MSLKFNIANAKLQWLAGIYRFVNGLVDVGQAYSFDLPAGHTCPGAKLCHSRVELVNDKRTIVDGPHCQFRCYAAMDEVRYPQVYRNRQDNLAVLRKLRTPQQIAKAILESVPSDCQIVRFHTSGDFFKQAYFDAALIVAGERPDILFYGYTKAIPLWVRRLDQYAALPNLVLNASLGGKYDAMARKHGLRTARVILTVNEAGDQPIDHDDSIASGIVPGGDFCLLIHGIQPAGSEAGKAVIANRKEGVFSGYTKGRKMGLVKK